MKISAIIPTLNEEQSIASAIKSVLFADEILVVDSFSTDKTKDIAKQYSNVKFLEHEYINPTAQKNWAIEQASNEWIIFLDADELVTEELATEIKQLKLDDFHKVVFSIERKNYFMGRHIKHVWKNDKTIRLFQNNLKFCLSKTVHEKLDISYDIKVINLEGKIIHNTYSKGLLHQIEKADKYTTWGAFDYKDKIKKVRMYHLIIRPIHSFIKHYIFKLGILDGKPGLYISVSSAINTFIKFIKVWRIHEGEKIECK